MMQEFFFISILFSLPKCSNPWPICTFFASISQYFNKDYSPRLLHWPLSTGGWVQEEFMVVYPSGPWTQSSWSWHALPVSERLYHASYATFPHPSNRELRFLIKYKLLVKKQLNHSLTFKCAKASTSSLNLSSPPVFNKYLSNHKLYYFMEVRVWFLELYRSEF